MCKIFYPTNPFDFLYTLVYLRSWLGDCLLIPILKRVIAASMLMIYWVFIVLFLNDFYNNETDDANMLMIFDDGYSDDGFCIIFMFL